MEAPAERNARSGKWYFLGGLVLLTVLGWHFGYQGIVEAMRNARPLPLLFMTVLILAGFWIRALKWHYALGGGRQGVLLFFIAKTAGNWTPGRAGELAPLLLKQHRNARVAAWIGLDRFIEVLATLGLGLAGVASLGLVGKGSWLILTSAGGGVGLVAIMVLMGQRRTSAAPIEDHATGWQFRLHKHTVSFFAELKLFLRKLPTILGLTFVAKLTDIYAVIALCSAFGYRADFLLVCAARCAHGLVSAIPITPDATGVPYVAAAWFLHDYAGIPFDVLTAALTLEVIAINAILWVCFCLVSARRLTSTSTE